VKAIADTGFLVAFADRRDIHHNWAVELALRLVRDGLVRPAISVLDHLDQLMTFARRYADRQPDLADLCLIRLSELFPDYPVITTDDRDFRVYRRGRRGVIPLILPSQR
jgi:predicted nucleic acid-binding protein